MAAFFWLTAWGATTNRPGANTSYTQNWPHEPLTGNSITGNSVVWSVISFVLLLGGVGAMVWYFGSQVISRQVLWFGTQGYEYLDLGRFWQILLFLGLTFWLG